MVDEGCAETYMECTALMNPKRDGGDIFGEVHIVGSETAMTVDSGPAYEQMSTFFSNVPKQITILCGPMEEMLTNCAFRNNVKTECPKSVGFIEHAIGQMIIKQNNMNGTVQPLWSNFPAYEEAKKYILKKCPTLPDNFTISVPCIEASLRKNDFINCFDSHTSTNATDEEKQSCDAYHHGKNCVMKFVEPSCGKEGTKIVIDAFDVFNSPSLEYCSKVSAVQGFYETVITFFIGCMLVSRVF